MLGGSKGWPETITPVYIGRVKMPVKTRFLIGKIFENAYILVIVFLPLSSKFENEPACQFLSLSCPRQLGQKGKFSSIIVIFYKNAILSYKLGHNSVKMQNFQNPIRTFVAGTI